MASGGYDDWEISPDDEDIPPPPRIKYRRDKSPFGPPPPSRNELPPPPTPDLPPTQFAMTALQPPRNRHKDRFAMTVSPPSRNEQHRSSPPPPSQDELRRRKKLEEVFKRYDDEIRVPVNRGMRRRLPPPRDEEKIPRLSINRGDIRGHRHNWQQQPPSSSSSSTDDEIIELRKHNTEYYE